jgi:hypothetical protein
VRAIDQYAKSLTSTIYQLHLTDGETLEIPARDLLDPRIFRKHVMTATQHVMTRIPRLEDWAAVVQVLLSVVVVHHAEESSEAGTIMSAVQSILDRYGAADDLSDDPLQGGRPFRHDGKVWITGPMLKEAMKGEFGQVPNAATQMHLLFGAPGRFNYYVPDGKDRKRVQRRYYGIPLERIDDTPS